MRDDILKQAEKPGRYIGNEINMVRKQGGDYTVRFGFCFPDVYEVGMSHLGLMILYFYLNARDDTYCERFFAPWVDMEKIMRRERITLTSLETDTPAASFDFLGFTLQYEMSYTNLINMLSLSGIPFKSADRGEAFPIICAGGPCAFNPEPLADFIDFFYLGEAEAALYNIIDCYKTMRGAGKTKNEILLALCKLPGVYAPRFYEFNNGINPIIPGIPKKISRVYVNDLDTAFFPAQFLVPLIETVHNRVTLELFRGCIRGCRFCHAGFITRPVRERSVDTLFNQADALLKTTGYDEISLVSLSSSDYTNINELTRLLVLRCANKNINLSLPSLRADALSFDLMKRIQSIRAAGLTIAPEAGSPRLRNIINKGLTDIDIIKGASLAFIAGIGRVKLYFMAGLPLETREDIEAIAALTQKILSEYYKAPKESRSRAININVSCSLFVPKAHTPFQWERQSSIEEFTENQAYVKALLTKKQIKYNYHDAKTAYIEGVLARGDRLISSVILKAWEHGARFDAWSDMFDINIWRRAFKETGIDPDNYTRARDLDEILPWEHIDTGVSKEFLLSERDKAYKGVATPNCREACAGCGILCV